MPAFVRIAFVAVLLLSPLAAQAEPQQPAVDPALANEQSYLDALSLRYSTEVADDDNLPSSFKKANAPKGASLLNLSW